MSMPIVPFSYSAQYSPLSNVTPFTYRDGLTFAEKLECLFHKIGDLIGAINANNSAVNLLDARVTALDHSVDERIADAMVTLRNEMAVMKDELLLLIENASPSGVVVDPTTGIIAPVAEVIGHVYDFDRYHALFATQLDARSQTAAELDATVPTARHRDLNVSATLNDVYPNE